ncbi:MAG: hypothetical protein QXE10_05595, partial [Desulfurococcaceae archaeon]
MAESLLVDEKSFLVKMELLRKLAGKDSVLVPELAGELGLTELEVVDLITELRENYMITHEKINVSWI